MMALGSFRGGGSSTSASNLSALAPPFTVDKSSPKPNSNTSVNLAEVPYATQFDASSQIWHHPLSSDSGPKFLESEPVATTCMPSSSVYGFPDSQMNNSTSTFPTGETAFNPFTYGGYSGGMTTTFINPKPYYSFVSAARHGDCGLVGTEGASYDLLSNSESSQPKLPSQVNYSENVVGLEYTPSWGSYWNGAINGKEDKWMEIGGTFDSKDYKSSTSSACKSFTTQVEGPVCSLLSGPGSYTSQYLPGYPAAEDVKSFLKPNPTALFECPKMYLSGPVSSYKESCHFEEPVVNPMTTLRGSQSANNLSERSADLASSYAFDFTSTTKSSHGNVVTSPSCGSSMSAKTMSVSGELTATYNNVFDGSNNVGTSTVKYPTVVISPPSGSSFSTQTAVASEKYSRNAVSSPANGSSMSAKTTSVSAELIATCNNVFDGSDNVGTSAMKYQPVTVAISPPSGSSFSTQTAVASEKYSRNAVFTKMEDFAEYDPFRANVPNLPLDLHMQFHGGMSIADSFFARPSTTRAGPIDSKPDDKNAFDRLLMGESECHTFSSSYNGLKLKVDVSDASTSCQKSSDVPEIHNPAVDSPCWKGAPAAGFSSFRASNDVSLELPVKNLEVCDSLDNDGMKFAPLNAANVLTISSGSVNERTTSERAWVYDSLGPGSIRQTNCCEVDVGDGVKYVDSGNENEGTSNSSPGTDSDTKKCLSEESIPDDGKVNSNGELMPHAVAVSVKGGESTDSSIEGSSCSSARLEKLVPASGKKTISQIGKSQGRKSSSPVDTKMLVDTMKNLSEVLRQEYTNNTAGIKGQDHMDLESIIDNVRACILLIGAERVTPIEDVLPQKVAPSSPGLPLRASLGRSKVGEVAAADGPSNWVSVKDAAGDGLGTGENDHLAEDIGKALLKSFPVEKTNSQALLYKNLWLEAEAGLCAYTVRARFNRMKLEMDSSADDEAKGLGYVRSPKNSSEIQGIDDVGARVKDSPDPGVIHDNESLISSTTCRSDDVEASVMDRFHILKARVDSSNSIKTDRWGVSIGGGSSAECQSKDITANDDAEYEIEAYLTATVQEIIDSDVDNPDMTDTGGRQFTGKQGGPHEDLPIPGNSFQASYFTDDVGQDVDAESSVMARFRILKIRDNSKMVVKDAQPHGHSAYLISSEDGNPSLDVSLFRSYQNFPGHENVMKKASPTIHGLRSAESCEAERTRELDFSLLDEDYLRTPKAEQGNKDSFRLLGFPTGAERRLLYRGLDGWYDSPTSEWEHVSKEEFFRQM